MNIFITIFEKYLYFKNIVGIRNTYFFINIRVFVNIIFIKYFTHVC